MTASGGPRKAGIAARGRPPARESGGRESGLLELHGELPAAEVELERPGLSARDLPARLREGRGRQVGSGEPGLDRRRAGGSGEASEDAVAFVFLEGERAAKQDLIVHRHHDVTLVD